MTRAIVGLWQLEDLEREDYALRAYFGNGYYLADIRLDVLLRML